MRAGQLRDVATLQTRTVTGDDQAGHAITWGSDAQIQCNFQKLTEMSARIITRFFQSVYLNKENYRLLADGKIWVLTAAIPDGRRTMLTIDCDLGELVEVTTITSTEKQYIDGVPEARPPDD